MSKRDAEGGQKAALLHSARERTYDHLARDTPPRSSGAAVVRAVSAATFAQHSWGVGF